MELLQIDLDKLQRHFEFAQNDLDKLQEHSEVLQMGLDKWQRVSEFVQRDLDKWQCYLEFRRDMYIYCDNAIHNIKHICAMPTAFNISRSILFSPDWNPALWNYKNGNYFLHKKILLFYEIIGSVIWVLFISFYEFWISILIFVYIAGLWRQRPIWYSFWTSNLHVLIL